MPIDLDGIGGIVHPAETTEGFNAIPGNTTLMAGTFTAHAPAKPEIIKDLTTVDKVFEVYAPAVDMEMENEDGIMQKETIRFRKIKDFSIEGITEQSPILNSLKKEKDQYHTITKELKTNKRLGQALRDEPTKQAFIKGLQALLEELDEPAED